VSGSSDEGLVSDRASGIRFYMKEGESFGGWKLYFSESGKADGKKRGKIATGKVFLAVIK